MFRSMVAALLLAMRWLTLDGAQALAQMPTPEAKPILKVVDTFKIGGTDRWDYPMVDADAQRLYVTRGTHLQVIDTASGNVVGDVPDLVGSHGTALVKDKNLGFVTSGRENAIVAFDLDSFKAVRKISTSGAGGRNPDAIVYDPASRKVFAFCAGGDAVAIDPAKLDTPPTAIACGGKLEYGQTDGAGRVFVNDEDHSQILVIDSRALKLTDQWPLAPVDRPNGLAIDMAHGRLFSVGRNQKMAVLNCSSGKILATVDIGKGVDGCAFDPQLGLVLSANGADGTVTAVGETSPGQFSVVQTVPTLRSGRTITNDPLTHRFYIPATVPAEGETASGFGIVVVGLVK